MEREAVARDTNRSCDITSRHTIGSRLNKSAIGPCSCAAQQGANYGVRLIHGARISEKEANVSTACAVSASLLKLIAPTEHAADRAVRVGVLVNGLPQSTDCSVNGPQIDVTSTPYASRNRASAKGDVCVEHQQLKNGKFARTKMEGVIVTSQRVGSIIEPEPALRLLGR
jgi:hypothetical protein